LRFRSTVGSTERIVAQPRPGRKGWRAVIRAFGLVVLAMAAVPLSFFVAMLVTPVLWRLEGVIGIELAGHSGPADWIIAAIFGLSVMLSVILLRLTRARGIFPTPPGTATPPTRGDG
jgi:hypothetical protein